MLTGLKEIPYYSVENFRCYVKNCPRYKDPRQDKWVKSQDIEQTFNWKNGSVYKRLNTRKFNKFLKIFQNMSYKHAVPNNLILDYALLPTGEGLKRKSLLVEESVFNSLRCWLFTEGILSLNASLNEHTEKIVTSWQSRNCSFKRGMPPESHVRDEIAELESGIVEVKCPVGRVDVLTLLEVIEVKYVEGWKAALGQAMAYKYFFPGKTPRIHLYGFVNKDHQQIINSVCESCGVKVTYSLVNKFDHCDYNPTNKWV